MLKWLKETPLRVKALQAFLLILHLLLLKWILFLLSEAGHMSPTVVFYHFAGISASGAGLIRICAYLGKRSYLKEQRKINGMETNR